MEKYDYVSAVREDIKEALEEYFEYKDINEFSNFDRLAEDVYEYLWIQDNVTGSASGSYTFSAWKAEENLCHNLDLLQETIDEFSDGSYDILKEGAERADVAIRCYLLGQEYYDILREYVEKHYPDVELI